MLLMPSVLRPSTVFPLRPRFLAGARLVLQILVNERLASQQSSRREKTFGFNPVVKCLCSYNITFKNCFSILFFCIITFCGCFLGCRCPVMLDAGSVTVAVQPEDLMWTSWNQWDAVLRNEIHRWWVYRLSPWRTTFNRICTSIDTRVCRRAVGPLCRSTYSTCVSCCCNWSCPIKPQS